MTKDFKYSKNFPLECFECGGPLVTFADLKDCWELVKCNRCKAEHAVQYKEKDFCYVYCNGMVETWKDGKEITNN